MCQKQRKDTLPSQTRLLISREVSSYSCHMTFTKLQIKAVLFYINEVIWPRKIPIFFCHPAAVTLDISVANLLKLSVRISRRSLFERQTTIQSFLIQPVLHDICEICFISYYYHLQEKTIIFHNKLLIVSRRSTYSLQEKCPLT